MVPPLTPGTTSAAPMQNPLAIRPTTELAGAPVAKASDCRPFIVSASAVIRGAQLVYRVNQRGYAGRVNVRGNAVAEIEHVAATAAVALQ